MIKNSLIKLFSSLVFLSVGNGKYNSYNSAIFSILSKGALTYISLDVFTSLTNRERVYNIFQSNLIQI